MKGLTTSQVLAWNRGRQAREISRLRKIIRAQRRVLLDLRVCDCGYSEDKELEGHASNCALIIVDEALRVGSRGKGKRGR